MLTVLLNPLATVKREDEGQGMATPPPTIRHNPVMTFNNAQPKEINTFLKKGKCSFTDELVLLS